MWKKVTCAIGLALMFQFSKLKDNSSFPIRAYGSRTPILGHVTVTGEKWRKLFVELA
jgi:hypothetical protein